MLDQRKAEKYRTMLTKWMTELDQELEQAAVESAKDEDAQYADWTDVATIETTKAMELKIRDRERNLVTEIQAALRRIDDKTFGECERCGDDISESRLKARPTTTLCIDCKTELEGSAHRFR